MPLDCVCCRVIIIFPSMMDEMLNRAHFKSGSLNFYHQITQHTAAFYIFYFKTLSFAQSANWQLQNLERGLFAHYFAFFSCRFWMRRRVRWISLEARWRIKINSERVKLLVSCNERSAAKVLHKSLSGLLRLTEKRVKNMSQL